MSDTSAQPLSGEPKKKSKKKVIWISIAAVVGLLIIVSVATGGGSSDSGTTAAETTEAGAPATEEVAADDEAPAEEEAPADTSAFYADNFGDFAPVSEKGKGDAIVALPPGATGGIVTATHKGSANFAISLLDANNQSTGDLLVNTIGAYKGTTAYGISSLGEPVKMEISADGPWTIEIAPMGTAPVLALPTKGTGDAVFRYDGSAADWKAEHKGNANFVILQTDDFMPNLAVNEIGNYSGVIPMQAGPSIVTVQADGKWSIS